MTVTDRHSLMLNTPRGRIRTDIVCDTVQVIAGHFKNSSIG